MVVEVVQVKVLKKNPAIVERKKEDVEVIETRYREAGLEADLKVTKNDILFFSWGADDYKQVVNSVRERERATWVLTESNLRRIGR